MNNYWLVSLLPVFEKIFEKLIFNEIYSFLNRKNFSLQDNLVRPFDLHENQFLIITHEKYFSFDYNPLQEVG